MHREVAAYSYYDDEQRLAAIAVRPPSGNRRYQVWLPQQETETFSDQEPPHQDVFKCYDELAHSKVANPSQATPLTTVPMFSSTALRLHVAEQLAQTIREQSESGPEQPLAQLLNDAHYRAVTGSHACHASTPFQPAERLGQPAIAT